MLYLLFFFALGTIVGSFLNVVVFRYGARKLSGRSLCFSCGKVLYWYELLPVASYLVQRGRCRSCKAGISFQYPFVELLTGIIFSAIAWKESSVFFSSFSVLHTSYLILLLVLWSELVALSVYDIRHKIIPDALVYSAALISFLIFLYSYFILHTSSFLDFWSGFLFAAPLALLWFLSRGRAIGLGDAKLVLLFPWVLTFPRGLSALIIGFWLGALVGLGALLFKGIAGLMPARLCPTLRAKLRRVGMKTELPLGPFLVLGLFLVYFFGWDVTGLGMLLAE